MKTFKDFKLEAYSLLEDFKKQDFLPTDYGAVISPKGKFVRVIEFQDHVRTIKTEFGISFSKFLKTGGVRIVYPRNSDINTVYFELGIEVTKPTKAAVDTLLKFVKFSFSTWKKQSRTFTIGYSHDDEDNRFAVDYFREIGSLEKAFEESLSIEKPKRKKK